jgi:hypothetical protein
MSEVMNRFTGLVVVWCFVLLSPASAAAGIIIVKTGTSISAETAFTVSNKFGVSGGTIDDPGRSGAEVFPGGSGAGSEFLANDSDALHHEVIFAGAYQNWGIFGGDAGVDIRADLGNFAEGWRADAQGVSVEDWTITGGTGVGFLKLGFQLTGSITSGSSLGDQFAGATISISVQTNAFPPGGQGQAGGMSAGGFHGNGLYETDFNWGGPLAFTFGIPVTVRITSTIDAFTSGNTNGFTGTAVADFAHTSTLSHIGVTDLFGNPVSNFEITASSGTQYDANGVHFSDTNGAVPEPSAIVLWGIGGLCLTIVSLRRHRRSGHQARVM